MRILLSFIFLMLCFFTGAYFAKQQLEAWGQRTTSLESAQILQIPRGTSLATLSGLLADRKIVSSARLFQIWVRLKSSYSEFQAGQYRFEGEVSPESVSRAIRGGQIYQPVVLEVNIPEGFRISQIVDRYVAAGVGSREQFEALISDSTFLESLKLPKPNIEGFFYPATYRYYKKPTAKEVLRKGVEVFFEKLPADYEQQVEAMGISLYEAVIFGSLIELETKYDDERPFVSEVIWRRYKDGVALAIDASIIYGIKDYRGNLSRRHLRDAKNPYNTRVHKGWPPTPIGAPSVQSLAAILTPSDNGYYYYVVDAEKGDRHHFSKTLKEHNTWVRKLVKTQRQANREARAQQRQKRAQERKAKMMERRARREQEKEQRKLERESLPE